MFAAEPAHCAPRAMSRSFGDSALPTFALNIGRSPW
jgi:hypothetical protein